ncbi:MAG: DivIVA domain-containing protein [Acidimicrobiales bacterium]
MSEDHPIAVSSSHLAPEEVARHNFGLVRRGFDPEEVRAFLDSVAAEMRRMIDRERDLIGAIADAEHRAANPVLDERTLTSALGTETARVLHSAHDAASEVLAKAEAETESMLTEARQEIDRRQAEADAMVEAMTTEAETSVRELRSRTDREVAEQLGSAHKEVDQLLDHAREQCRDMIEEAQGLRSKVLADLSKRRRVLHAQIEQLRAGRERLAETIHDVRRSVDGIASELFAAEDNARQAAEEAGRQSLERPEDHSPTELAAMLVEEPAAADREEMGAGGEVADPEMENGEAVEGGEAIDSEMDNEVDALFAKLRAARRGQPRTDGNEGGAGDEAATAGNEGRTGDEEHAGGDGSEMPVASDGEPPADRHPLAAQRDILLEPVVTRLGRRLKRALQDDQNELLDRVRSHASRWSDSLMPELSAQIDSFSTAALPLLEQAAEAGHGFVDPGLAGGSDTDVLVGITRELAESVIGPLRRKLTDDEGLADADEQVVADHIGSAFREWKGERIERLAADHVVKAFSTGTMAAARSKSMKLEWMAVAGANDDPCPDCEDNGLNGSQLPGEEFPTGNRCPPAHSGCRCLLVPVAT